MENNKDFLKSHFTSAFAKLNAEYQANKIYAHQGIKGASNEQILAKLLRTFLPERFRIETNVVVIDRRGKESNECDLIICDSTFPKYFEKAFPIETVFAFIEVKTTLDSIAAKDFIEKTVNMNNLSFTPLLTPYYNTQNTTNLSHGQPPASFLFSYESKPTNLETIYAYFDKTLVNDTIEHLKFGPMPLSHRYSCITGLDFGIIEIEQHNNFIKRLAPYSSSKTQEKTIKRFNKHYLTIDKSKSLFMFLENLWSIINLRETHPGFDIRSYMTVDEEEGFASAYDLSTTV